EDVTVCANYSSRPVDTDENGKYIWAMERVIDQANDAQKKYGNPKSDDYIPNYNIVAATNGDGYNMYTGEPGGLLLMDGIEYHPCDGSGFFGILADGTAKIGSQAEYEKLKAEGKIKEAIGGFGATLVKDGKIAVTVNSDYFNDRAPRTAVGITKTGKVVMMVMDGRQEDENASIDSSCGGSAIEIAQVMLDAGCVEAINLDGGGSSTYVAKEEGSSELAVVSKPSDGTSRSVSTSLYAVSTAPSSTEFDHAVIESEYAHMTAGTTIQMTATGVSATNNVVDLPEGTEWAVSDAEKATITEDGQLTAKFNGTVDVMLMLDEEVLGKKAINIVTPDNLYFTKKAVNLIYEESVEMPIKAVYNNKPVAINEEDIKFELSDEKAGTFDGFDFTASLSEIRVLKITAKLPSSLVAKAEMTVYLYTADEASFDFDNAAGGDEQLAWKREVSNSASKDNKTYTAIDRDADMVTEYSFAIDMSKIQIPGRLGELVYMLPGSDNPDATAWTFLCDLAERISEWTEVSASIVFDEDVVFDPSSIKDIKLV
ncbi:MAG: phosphodiester glycosidase family protein, partial [Firmicutes bacterium]|nr:phosphodiester glycosidase family protein [Bacillota bacterium]